jgi:hypothetical protein
MKKAYTLDEVYKIFGKSKKLKVLGFTEGYSTNLENVFFYVDDELSTKEFYQLNSKDKSAYIRKLFNLPEEELTSMGEYILNINGKKEIKKINYFSLEDLSQPIDEPVNEDYSDLIKDIPNQSMESIREYMRELFSNWYEKWEFDLRQSTPNKFIKAISNEIKLNELDKAMIKEFVKRLK